MANGALPRSEGWEALFGIMRPMKTPCVVALAIAAACVAPPARAGEPLPADARHILATRFAGWAVESRSAGALQAEGARDLALVLVRPDAPQTHAVAVFLDDGHGGWRFSKSSGAIDVGAHGEALAAEIRGHALVVRTTDPGARVAVVTSYRFAYRNEGRALRLVGLDIERFAPADAAQGWRDTTSVDLLSGVKHEAMDDRDRGRARRRESESRVPLRQPILFEQFAFDLRGLRAEAAPRFEPGGGQR
jgi:hypothetical protein